ncbi:hypothetical protein [Trichormus sp. NMC-1]|uniref:hypothetical protein n=1 Tax=Trichormus sp. NMC-1 TaxID=1853259 RepID=UPI0008DC2505|nr:hypothetical protein [Trichormus sp. NMC-1]
MSKSKRKKNNNPNHDQLELNLIFPSLDSQDNKENNQDQSIVNFNINHELQSYGTQSLNNQQNLKKADFLDSEID